MRISASTRKETSSQKTIFIPLFEKEPPFAGGLFDYLPPSTQEILRKFAGREFRGIEGETRQLWLPQGKPEKIILFGLGEKSKWSERKLRILARRVVRFAKNENIKELGIELRKEFAGTEDDAAKIFAQNALLADFEFNRYKEPPKKEEGRGIKNIFIAVGKNFSAKLQKNIKEGAIIGEEVNACRDLANTPGGDITPRKLAEAADRVARKNNIGIKILDEKRIAKIGMGGIAGVSKGSEEKPRFIILEYKGGAAGEKPLVLVGKGVTFDTGGLNLKPDQAIYEMHMDMSGGAAVIHGMAAIARLKLPANVIGLIPAVENMPSGSSYRPGDILRTLSGKTVEVLNTDAEGRIILADALAYALRLKPAFILDLATLTGAAHVALGNYSSALFTNRPEIQAKLIAVGENSGDYVWPLPLWDEYLPEIKGTFGDLANVGGKDKYGGAIHGAKFLEQFVENIPWAHLDIAPRMTTVESDFLAKGASGAGVRYVVELAKNYKDFKRSR